MDLVVGLSIIPLPGGDSHADWNLYNHDELFYKNYPDPNPLPWGGHGNSTNNTNTHIVYAFGFAATDGKTPILKYGIPDEFRYGMDRPENQLAALRAKYGPTVMYSIYARKLDREMALIIERTLVLEHKAMSNGALPREQISPNP